ncbi:hypothetical protein [Halorubrum sp. Atlit-26R]|uniref:hypothetical protein n=1 Tax=Halorubrum sp. Atlit-26R TaxID=2282128 RepID=UPI000EF17D83|nr:hypothetical protein [Halorubrum sp. Atlit-26R]RLM72357.1 hypothetical protein DVK07_07230 [Halorubrum sp. Atlit-26R]
MDFATEAHVGEYVVNSERTVSFTAADGEVSYAPPSEDTPVSVPVGDVTAVEFERNTAFLRHTFLGLFFLLVSLVLTVGIVAAVYLGRVETRTEVAFAGFLGLFAVGGWNVTYGLLSRPNREVIDVYITTEERTHVLCGELADAEFVDACGELIGSDVPTTNRNPKLEAELE